MRCSECPYAHVQFYDSNNTLSGTQCGINASIRSRGDTHCMLTLDDKIELKRFIARMEEEYRKGRVFDDE